MSDGTLAALDLPSTADRVFAELRRQIISGGLEPGQRLNENLIAEQLGVSRSPVREAFQRLVAERLLTAARNKSVRVTAFTAADVEEIYDARIAIETHSALTVIRRGPDRVQDAITRLSTALEQLGAALATGDRLDIARADLHFHQELVRCGGNSRLTETYLLLSAETVTCIARLEIAKPSGAELMQDHQDIIDALVTKDPAVIGRTIASHLGTASTNLVTPSTHPAATPTA